MKIFNFHFCAANERMFSLLDKASEMRSSLWNETRKRPSTEQRGRKRFSIPSVMLKKILNTAYSFIFSQYAQIYDVFNFLCLLEKNWQLLEFYLDILLTTMLYFLKTIQMKQDCEFKGYVWGKGGGPPISNFFNN